MFNKITQYITINVSVAFIVSCTSIVTLVFLSESLRLFDLVVNKGINGFLLLQLILTTFPEISSYLFPILIMLSIAFLWRNMSNNQEIIIIRALGIKPYQMFKPILIICILVTIANTYFVNFLSPSARTFYKESLEKIASSSNLSLIEENKVNNIGPKLSIYTEEVQGNNLLNVIVEDNRNPERQITLYAKKGSIENSLHDEGLSIIFTDVSLEEKSSVYHSTSFYDIKRLVLNIDDNTSSSITTSKGIDQLDTISLLNNENLSSERVFERKLEVVSRLYNSFTPLISGIITFLIFVTGSFSRLGNVSSTVYSSIFAITLTISSLFFIPFIIPSNIIYIALIMFTVQIAIVTFGMYKLFRY